MERLTQNGKDHSRLHRLRAHPLHSGWRLPLHENWETQGSWNILLEEQPDLHLTVGDTHYADTTNPTVQLEHHLTYRKGKGVCQGTTAGSHLCDLGRP